MGRLFQSKIGIRLATCGLLFFALSCTTNSRIEEGAETPSTESSQSNANQGANGNTDAGTVSSGTVDQGSATSDPNLPTTTQEDDTETEQSSIMSDQPYIGLRVDYEVRVEPQWYWPGMACAGLTTDELISEIAPGLVQEAGFDIEEDNCRIEHTMAGTESLAVVSCAENDIHTFYTTEQLCLFERHSETE